MLMHDKLARFFNCESKKTLFSKIVLIAWIKVLFKNNKLYNMENFMNFLKKALVFFKFVLLGRYLSFFTFWQKKAMKWKL